MQISKFYGVPRRSATQLPLLNPTISLLTTPQPANAPTTATTTPTFDLDLHILRPRLQRHHHHHNSHQRPPHALKPQNDLRPESKPQPQRGTQPGQFRLPIQRDGRIRSETRDGDPGLRTAVHCTTLSPLDPATSKKAPVANRQTKRHRLSEQGHPLGMRLLPLLLYRAPATPTTRPTSILPLLQFIHTPLWRHLFGRPADTLERSSTTENEYMLTDNEPLVNTYVSVPREMNMLNCAAFVAGVVEGVCDGLEMPARVSAHNAASELWPGRTVFLIRFEGKSEVIQPFPLPYL